MAARKSMLFLNTVLPVTRTHDDVVRMKFKPGKFILTYTGCIKLAGNVILITSSILTLSSTYCDPPISATSKYLAWIPQIVASVISLGLYLMFCFGFAAKRPGVWVKTDIVFNLIFPIASIICSIISMTDCTRSTSLHKVPGPLSISGGIVLVIGCAAIFLLYRYREEENDEKDNVKQSKAAAIEQSRKSVFA